jgi:ribosomal protein S18 acetylase RimI-like enzyme
MTERAPNQRPAALTIVQAQLEHYHHVARLFGALHAFNAQLDGRFALDDAWPELLRTHLAQSSEAADSLWLLAWLGERPVGLLLMEEHTDAPIFLHRHWGEVVALYVDNDVRGHGVAQALLEHGYRWARGRGLACVQLYVTASNQAARRFYHKEGFADAQMIMRKVLADEQPPAADHPHRSDRIHFSESGQRPLDMHWRDHQD